MRKYLLLYLMVWSMIVVGQLAEPIVFTEKMHDFGSIAENGGNVDTEFTFINKSGRPIKILTVQPSCGCTTPQWTREAVEDGKTGVIKASFDPRGKSGYFNKSITVTTDYEGSPITLAIKGNVESQLKSKDESDFDVANGALRTRVSTLNIGKIFLNKDNGPWSFDVLNGGKSSLTFAEVKSPAYIKVILPKELKAGERGILKIQYDAKMKNAYGFASDNIEIMTNDTESPLKTFSVFATVEEFFPPITAAALEVAPILKIENADIKFGDLQETATLQREVVVSNQGKKELSIRALQPNCTCLTVSADVMVLKPSQSTKIRISFLPKGRPGIQNKSIAIYSNDPRNPVQRITLSGYVR